MSHESALEETHSPTGFQAVENKDPRRTSVENQGPEGIRQDQDWPSQEQKSHETRMVS